MDPPEGADLPQGAEPIEEGEVELGADQANLEGLLLIMYWQMVERSIVITTRYLNVTVKMPKFEHPKYSMKKVYALWP